MLISCELARGLTVRCGSNIEHEEVYHTGDESYRHFKIQDDLSESACKLWHNQLPKMLDTPRGRFERCRQNHNRLPCTGRTRLIFRGASRRREVMNMGRFAMVTSNPACFIVPI